MPPERKFLDLDNVEVRSRDRIFMSRPKNAPYCLFYTTKRTFYREILLPDTRRHLLRERVRNGEKEKEKKAREGKSGPHLLNLFKNLLPIYLLYLCFDSGNFFTVKELSGRENFNSFSLTRNRSRNSLYQT